MFKPCGSQVLVKQIPVKETTAGGIITSSAIEQSREQMGKDVGVLIEVGPMAWEFVADDGKTFIQPQAKVGDVVIFAKYAGKQFTEGEVMNGRRSKDEPYYHLMSSADILGVMPEDMAKQYKEQRGV